MHALHCKLSPVIKTVQSKSLLLSAKCSCFKSFTLKVDGKEKYGGSRFLQLLGISLGPWQSMPIFILNVPFAIEKRIFFSALSSKMNRRFV
jgi:hypothetical protein